MIGKKPEITTKKISFRDYDEYYISFGYDSLSGKFLENYLFALKKEHIKIIRIDCFVSEKSIGVVAKKIRNYPNCIVGYPNSPEEKRSNVGVNIYAVKGKFESFEYIRCKNRVVGAYFEVSGRENLCLSDIGTDDEKVSDFKEEVEKVYLSIDKIISRYNFSPRNIYRFWNYMENILLKGSRNYIFFNEARDEYFKKHRITDYPSATGIEAKLAGRRKISISLEAVKAKGKNKVFFKTLHSGLQCDPWEYGQRGACNYGPKFSRGKILNFKTEGVRKVFISGTSSVDRRGKSILRKDARKNISYVLECVEHLLKKVGVTFENIVMAKVYFKSSEVEAFFEKKYIKNHWNFPFNSIIADICRKNFLFELECVASDQLGKNLTKKDNPSIIKHKKNMIVETRENSGGHSE